MITETATPERQAGSWLRKWAHGADRLVTALVLLTVGGLLCLLLLSVAVRPFGYGTFVLYGSSMEPAIKVGSLLLAKPVNVDDLKVDDIIVFRLHNSGTTMTHRIMGIRQEDGQRYFQTKGDASTSADPLEVTLEDGAQRVAYHMPYLGYFVDFAKGTTGMILLLVLPAIGLLGLHWANSRRPEAPEAEAAEASPEG